MLFGDFKLLRRNVKNRRYFISWNFTTWTKVLLKWCKVFGRGFCLCCSLNLPMTHVHALFALSPYKIQTRELLSAAALNSCETFASLVLQQLHIGKINVGDIHHWSEIFSWMDSFINKRTWWICGTENPHIAVPSSLNPTKFIVWAIISSKRLFESFFSIQTIIAALLFGHIVWIFVNTKCFGRSYECFVIYARHCPSTFTLYGTLCPVRDA